MKIPKHVFPIVECAAKDQTRYVINGVALIPHGDHTVEAAATDGRRLLAVKFKTDGPLEIPRPVEDKKAQTYQPPIIGAAMWKKVGAETRKLRPIRKEDKAADIALATTGRKDDTSGALKASFTVGAARFEEETFAGLYPRIDQVIPKLPDDAPYICCSARLLGELLLTITKIMEDNDEADDTTVRLSFESPHRPMLITAPGITGVLMPVTPKETKEEKAAREAAKVDKILAEKNQKAEAAEIKAKSAWPNEASNVVQADFTPPAPPVVSQEEIDKLLAEAAAMLAAM